MISAISGRPMPQFPPVLTGSMLGSESTTALPPLLPQPRTTPAAQSPQGAGSVTASSLLTAAGGSNAPQDASLMHGDRSSSTAWNSNTERDAIRMKLEDFFNSCEAIVMRHLRRQSVVSDGSSETEVSATLDRNMQSTRSRSPGTSRSRSVTAGSRAGGGGAFAPVFGMDAMSNIGSDDGVRTMASTTSGQTGGGFRLAQAAPAESASHLMLSTMSAATGIDHAASSASTQQRPAAVDVSGSSNSVFNRIVSGQLPTNNPTVSNSNVTTTAKGHHGHHGTHPPPPPPVVPPYHRPSEGAFSIQSSIQSGSLADGEQPAGILRGLSVGQQSVQLGGASPSGWRDAAQLVSAIERLRTGMSEHFPRATFSGRRESVAIGGLGNEDHFQDLIQLIAASTSTLESRAAHSMDESSGGIGGGIVGILPGGGPMSAMPKSMASRQNLRQVPSRSGGGGHFAMHIHTRTGSTVARDDRTNNDSSNSSLLPVGQYAPQIVGTLATTTATHSSGDTATTTSTATTTVDSAAAGIATVPSMAHHHHHHHHHQAAASAAAVPPDFNPLTPDNSEVLPDMSSLRSPVRQSSPATHVPPTLHVVTTNTTAAATNTTTTNNNSISGPLRSPLRPHPPFMPATRLFSGGPFSAAGGGAAADTISLAEGMAPAAAPPTVLISVNHPERGASGLLVSFAFDSVHEDVPAGQVFAGVSPQTTDLADRHSAMTGGSSTMRPGPVQGGNAAATPTARSKDGSNSFEGATRAIDEHTVLQGMQLQYAQHQLPATEPQQQQQRNVRQISVSASDDATGGAGGVGTGPMLESPSFPEMSALTPRHGSRQLSLAANSVFQLAPIIQNDYVLLGGLGSYQWEVSSSGVLQPDGSSNTQSFECSTESNPMSALAAAAQTVASQPPPAASNSNTVQEEVLLAYSLKLQQSVVVKMITFTSEGWHSNIAASRRLQEARRAGMVENMKRLKELRHPNLVRLFDVFLEPGTDRVYLVQEYCDGGSFGSLLANRKSRRLLRTYSVALHVVLSSLTSLEYLHSNGIAHRNLCPETIFMTNQGLVLLSGAGLPPDCSRHRLPSTLHHNPESLGGSGPSGGKHRRRSNVSISSTESVPTTTTTTPTTSTPQQSQLTTVTPTTPNVNMCSRVDITSLLQEDVVAMGRTMELLFVSPSSPTNASKAAGERSDEDAEGAESSDDDRDDDTEDESVDTAGTSGSPPSASPPSPLPAAGAAITPTPCPPTAATATSTHLRAPPLVRQNPSPRSVRILSHTLPATQTPPLVTEEAKQRFVMRQLRLLAREMSAGAPLNAAECLAAAKEILNHVRSGR